MKTYTITLHSTDNCGSSLQAFALQQYLKRSGIDNEIIDYVPDYIKYNGHMFRYYAKRILYFKVLKKRMDNFESFKKKFLALSKNKYSTYKKLCEAKLSADCFITGSDQLWNSMFECGKDPAFFLEFTSFPKISYAVSIGEDSISENTKRNISKYADSFCWISLREKETVETVRQLVNCLVEHVCDPVLLNGTDTYDQVIDKQLVNGKYCVVYLAQSIDIELINELISRIRSELDCKIVLIGSIIKHCDCDIHMQDAGPAQFLSLIKYASFVISDSFHATVFSVMYKKQFLVVVPEKNGVRISSFLRMAGLQDRQIKSAQDKFAEISEKKYHEINKILSQIALNSGEKLLKQLDDINSSK